MMNSIKSTVRKVFSWNRGDNAGKLAEESSKDEETQLCEELQGVQDTEDTCSEDNAQETKSTVLTKVTYLLYFLLWITLYVIALKYQFGAVYFVLSALVFICLNTRSGPKKRDEPSAYSVFNPNCEAIEGTLDASQFEREIRYGGIGVR